MIAPHAGPWARDSYGFNPLHQWLANRGYAVLSVNFRGSTGFGRTLLNAGNGEWGGRMQEDLIDAAQWAVQSGIAEADRVAIVGEGYGGYAALAGLAFAPEQFRCAASFNAPANLVSLVESAPASVRDALYLRVGDPRTAEGRQRLRERSPASRASQIRSPLLLVLGARDASAFAGGFDQIAQSLRGRGVA
ncbi:MAG: prolyl oligopeptidase family serine peptidase [Hyphomonadaceae bacterium]